MICRRMGRESPSAPPVMLSYTEATMAISSFSPSMKMAKKGPLRRRQSAPTGTASRDVPTPASREAGSQWVPKFVIWSAARYAPTPKNTAWPSET